MSRGFKPLAGELAAPFDEAYDLAEYVVIPFPCSKQGTQGGRF